LPDLILIDGGRAQLNTVCLSLNTYHLASPLTQRGARGVIIPLVALAKQEEELYTIYSDKVLRLDKLPLGLRLTFQAIRNEAHRFAISYYRKLHRRKIVTD
ncbi:hypothetical protein KJ784_03620, partial [Patescibacteria group bacterium]|nr:hypothetical protein [Patescibacteria group bacterium]